MLLHLHCEKLSKAMLGSPHVFKLAAWLLRHAKRGKNAAR